MADSLEAIAARARALLTSGDAVGAECAYTEAIDLAETDEVLATLLANRSAARLRSAADWAGAAHDAALALSINPDSWRMRLRLAQALDGLGRSADASQQAAYVMQSKQVPVPMMQAAAALRRAAAETAASSATSQEGAGRMVVAEHKLRVHLCAPLPATLRVGGWHTISVRLTNEMGLFESNCFPTAASAHVRLHVVPLSPELRGGLWLTLRQAPEPPPAPDATRIAPGLVGDGPGRGCCGPTLRLHRGRATVEMRLEAREGLAAPEGASLAALHAVLLPPQASSGVDERGGDDEGVAALGAVSLPLVVSFRARGAVEARARSDELERGEEEAAALGLVRAALLPCVEAHEGALLDDCVQGFRLVECGAAGGSRAPPASETRAPLVLAESASGICGRIWDSGIWLAAWLGNHRARLEGERRDGCGRPSAPAPLRVLELGAGVGIGGLAVAALGAQVVLTDLAEAVPLLRINAEANAHRCAHRPLVAPLAWGSDADVDGLLSSLRETGSGWLVLCSDVVYEPAAYEPLLHTMRLLAARRVATRTLMAHRSRHPDEAAFFVAAARDFEIRLLCGPPFVPLGSAADTEPLRAEAPDDGVPGMPAPTEGGAVIRMLEFRSLAV